VSPQPGGPAGTPSDAGDEYARLERRLDKTVKDKGIQTELPLYEPEAPPKKLEFPKPPVSLAKAAVALALGGCVTLAFILVARARRARKLKEDAPPPAPSPRPRKELDAALKAVRDDADDLAKLGLFGEAVHALLLNGLEAFRKRDRMKVPPHLTSRELLPALPLNRIEDESLRELVFMTESSWFGGFRLGRPDYDSARSSFGRLLGSVSPSYGKAARASGTRPPASKADAPPTASGAEATPRASKADAPPPASGAEAPPHAATGDAGAPGQAGAP
jgi:hypothetical protein